MIRLASKTVLLIASLTTAGTVIAHESAKPPAPTPPAGTAPVSAAAATVERFSTALQAGDLETVVTLLADDVLVLESGGAERSREEYLGHHAPGDAAFLKDAHVQRTRRTERVEGSIAWIGTESEIHTTKDGKPMTLLSTETMVLRRAAGGWQIVHIHWSSRPKR